MELVIQPQQNKAPKPKAVKPPKPPTPKDNPKNPFPGKKIWKQAQANDPEIIINEVGRRIEMSIADALVKYLDELESKDKEKTAKKTDFRASIMKRAASRAKGSK